MVSKYFYLLSTMLLLSVTLSYYVLYVDVTVRKIPSWQSLLAISRAINFPGVGHTTDDRIYFLETSGRDSPNYRQSCAVESAARQNQDRPVYLFFTSKEVNLTSRSIQLLKEYDNIVIESIDLNDYFNNTPLEQWYHSGVWKTSPYSVSHLSDYLRFISVYKGGGQYLDLDFVVTKNFSNLRNYVVYEDDHTLCSGVFHFDSGHPLVEKMIQKLASEYQPEDWGAHGPLLVTKAVYSNCNISKGVAYGAACGSGVRLMSTSTFFPFRYSWKEFFKNRKSDKLPKIVSQAYAAHMWNKMSSQEPVFVGSSQYYAILAAKYCPLSFAAALHKL